MRVQQTFTAFVNWQRVASGPLSKFLEELITATASRTSLPLIFEDSTGKQIDFNLQGDLTEILARAEAQIAPPKPTAGRPKLGVTAREVTLLPRHWEWLEQQPNGASAALRRLVDEARKNDGGETETRQSTEAAGRFLTAVAGDLPRYEDATRALYARDEAAFRNHIMGWPIDVKQYAYRLAKPAFDTTGSA